jgi:hypothetical protein
MPVWGCQKRRMVRKVTGRLIRLPASLEERGSSNNQPEGTDQRAIEYILSLAYLPIESKKPSVVKSRKRV